ncbi:MAG TPA: gamma-glutamylcyclotransferase family protein [Candidatus Kryptonia bacterium]|nr:gamma-glutamylcyclotransferase family protein [Candidatus Kryptonia bacterium]
MPFPALVFVYGTLRDDTRISAVVGAASAWRRIGQASIRGQLYDVGPYPALRPGRGASDRVRGVVLEFADGDAALPLLDGYEEAVAAQLYVRRRCRARLANGRTVSAWVYVYNRSVRGLSRVVGGTWRKKSNVQSPRPALSGIEGSKV